MSGQFSFSFSGEDIDVDDEQQQQQQQETLTAAPAQPVSTNSAFPVAGKPLLPAASHDLAQMLSELPSKVAYGTLDVDLDIESEGEGEGERIRLPRRELWDVRVQLMAEDDSRGGDGGELEPGLGTHDVRTGIYEGGFKSWESSVDLVKVLRRSSRGLLSARDHSTRVIELGCGTGLPSLALFQWALDARAAGGGDGDDSSYPWLSFVLADYNPTVLQLVTLPNFLLSWALHQQQQKHPGSSDLLKDAFSSEGDELDLTPEVLEAFTNFLSSRKIALRFFSGAWSPEFVSLVTAAADATRTGAGAGPGIGANQATVIIGAETIYSPFALGAFAQTLFALLEDDKARGDSAEAFVGAKKLYFGVGGSLDDFVAKAKELGAITEQVWEETEGVRRGVVRCRLP